MSNRSDLHSIRFIIYISLFVYAVVNLTNPPDTVEFVNPSVFSSQNAAAFVGITQLVLCTLGLIADTVGERLRPMIQPVFLLLTLTFLYSGVLLLVNATDPFSWIPLFVYAAICAVVYLAER